MYQKTMKLKYLEGVVKIKFIDGMNALKNIISVVLVW